MGTANTGPKRPRTNPDERTTEKVPGFLLTPSRRRRLEAKPDEAGLARLALGRTHGSEPTD